MTAFPDAIYAPRVKNNASGVEYDETKDTRLYAEDVVGLDDEVVAVETILGENPEGEYDTVGDRIAALEGGGGGDTVVAKTATEIVNNSSVWQDDDELYFDYEINSTYTIEICLLVDYKAASDFKCRFLPGATVSGRISQYTLLPANGADSITTQYTVSATVNRNTLVRIQGVFFVGGTAGTMKLQWAQYSAQAEDTSVLAGSWLKYRKIA